MAIVKEIIINVTDDDAKKGLSNINKLFDEMEQSEQKAVETTKSLRAQLKQLQTELQSGNLTGKEFDEGVKRAAAMKDQIIDVNNRIKALATDAADVALSGITELTSGIVGGFAAAQGAMALFGSENEDVEKAILKLQGSIALLNGVQAVNNALQGDSAAMMSLQNAKLKLLTGIQTVYSTVVGVSTGALKAFRIALISTGIGAIVVAVGLLIANFEKVSGWVTSLIDKFGGWRQVLMFVAPPIWAIIKALEALGVIESEAEEKVRKASEERIAQRRKEVKELDKQKEKVEGYYDFEIRKAKALGKDVEELEKAKRKAILETLLLQNASQRDFIFSSQATQDEIKAWNERQKEIKKIREDMVVAENEAIFKQQQKRNEAAKKAAEEAKKRAEEEKRLAKEKAAEEFRIAEEAIKVRDQSRKEQLENRKKFIEDEAALEEAALMADIHRYVAHETWMKEARQRLLDEEIEFQNQLIQTEIDLQEAKRSAAEEGLNMLQQFAGRNKAIALAVLATQKGLAIADVVVNASKSIAGQISANALSNKLIFAKYAAVPGGQFAATAEIAKAAVLLKKGIASTKISAATNIASILAAGLQGAGNINASSGGGGGGGGAAGGGGETAPTFNLVGDAGLNQIAQGQAGQQPVEAYVVAGNVTTAQSLNRNIINNATF